MLDSPADKTISDREEGFLSQALRWETCHDQRRALQRDPGSKGCKSVPHKAVHSDSCLLSASWSTPPALLLRRRMVEKRAHGITGVRRSVNDGAIPLLLLSALDACCIMIPHERMRYGCAAHGGER